MLKLSNAGALGLTRSRAGAGGSSVSTSSRTRSVSVSGTLPPEVAAKMRELGLTKVRVIDLLGGVMSINYGEKA